MKCQYILVFNGYQYCPYITSEVSDNETIFSRSNFLENVISDFKYKGYNFNQIAEMNIMTKANELDRSYDFYIRHNMHAVEWKLNALFNNYKSLINKLNRNWRNTLKENLKVIVCDQLIK